MRISGIEPSFNVNKKLSILISFSWFSIFFFLHISKSPATITYPIAHTGHKDTQLTFGFTTAWLYDQLRIKCYFML